MEDLAVFFRPLLARRARQLRSAGMETCQLAPDAEDRPERPWALRRALGNHRKESWSRSASFDVPLPTSIYTFPRPPPLACCPFPLFFYLRRMSNGGEDTQDDEAILARIKAGGPLEVYHLPRAILEGEDLPFVVVVEMNPRMELLQEAEAIFWQVHRETDENEFDVYSHRILRSDGEGEEHSMCLVVEYDNRAAFLRHYEGETIKKFYAGDYLETPPKLAFYRDV